MPRIVLFLHFPIYVFSGAPTSTSSLVCHSQGKCPSWSPAGPSEVLGAVALVTKRNSHHTYLPVRELLLALAGGFPCFAFLCSLLWRQAGNTRKPREDFFCAPELPFFPLCLCASLFQETLLSPAASDPSLLQPAFPQPDHAFPALVWLGQCHFQGMPRFAPMLLCLPCQAVCWVLHLLGFAVLSVSPLGTAHMAQPRTSTLLILTPEFPASTESEW